MSIESELQQFIAAEVVTDGDAGVGVERPLIRSGRIDSMGLLRVLGFVEERYRSVSGGDGQPDRLRDAWRRWPRRSAASAPKPALRDGPRALAGGF